MIADDISPIIMHDHTFAGSISIQDFATPMQQVGVPDQYIPFGGKELFFG